MWVWVWVAVERVVVAVGVEQIAGVVGEDVAAEKKAVAGNAALVAAVADADVVAAVGTFAFAGTVAVASLWRPSAVVVADAVRASSNTVA